MGRVVKDRCPICGKRMVPGRRMAVTFKWEGANVDRFKYDYEARMWKKFATVGSKGSTVTVCPECGMRAAGAVGVAKPECVPW